MEGGIRGASLPLYAFRLNRMLGALKSSEELEEDKQNDLNMPRTTSASTADVDRKLAQALWGMWMENVPYQQPSIFAGSR